MCHIRESDSNLIWMILGNGDPILGLLLTNMFNENTLEMTSADNML